MSAIILLSGQQFQLHSPDGQLSARISIGDKISFSVYHNNANVLEISELSMDLGDGKQLGVAPRLKHETTKENTETISVQVPNKDAVIESSYSEISFQFKGGYQLMIRAYNDGIAYRFEDQNQTTTKIVNEVMQLVLPENALAYFPQEESMYSHNERLYLHKSVSEITTGDFCSLPVMFDTKSAKVLFTEASLHNYPGMFLAKREDGSFGASFPKYVLKAVPNQAHGPDRNQIIEEEANYIAVASGPRAYPWRVFIISDDDRTFVESNLVTQLSATSKIPDADWIKPGKVAWDWYNANNIYGVDFEAGLNMDTYKYYIDFASKNNIEYVILDEGWTKSTTEILEDSEELDVPELIAYAKTKNVGIILWVLWKPLYENPDEILKLYSSWGAVGIKVDFMQRSDQYVVESYEKIAEIAAGYELIVDYHGAFKPAGIERVWPNILNYEGVQGNEQNKWCANITPEHNVTIPFIRMAAGPMDFTPGSMVNVNKTDFETGQENFAAVFTRPMSYGTRAHQVAMYVVYEAPLQMLCESPTIYYKEQETVDFITQIPTTWDETVVLEAAVADHIIVARRKGEDWFIGGMTDWTAREFDIDLAFLGNGTFQMEFMQDGINAERNAQDYKMGSGEVNKDSEVSLKLSSGGGWAAILRKVKKGLGLNPLFSDHMVFQQKRHVPIWGSYEPGETVSVAASWGESASAITDESGHWELNLPSPEAGGPFEVMISTADSSIQLTDVMVGEVWIASGQSNMEMPLGGYMPTEPIDNFETEIANANYPDIRFINVARAIALQAEESFAGEWTITSPATASKCSATAYFFARKLHEELGVPVGIISTNWGGTPVEAWASQEQLLALGTFQDEIEAFKEENITVFTDWYANFPTKRPPTTTAGWENFDLGDQAYSETGYDDTAWKTVALPAKFEDFAGQGTDGVMWFRKTVNIQDISTGYTYTVSDGIDDSDILYVNGHKVGSMLCWNCPRNYAIPKSVLVKGDNVFATRVIDTGGGGGFSGEMHLTSNSGRMVPIEGLWRYHYIADYKSSEFLLYHQNQEAYNNPPPGIESFQLNSHTPGVLFNGMIHPLIPFQIKGAIWYQGESNVGRAKQYELTFPGMIEDWRNRWGQEFPFYFVQIAPFNYGNELSPLLRDAQRKSLQTPNTGMAITLDIGHPTSIHPGNKQDVGSRLARLALANDYEKPVLASGPLYKSHAISGNTLVVSFDYTGSHLTKKDNELSGFEIAGADGQFVPAKAIIIDNKVVVSAIEVTEPVFVRYGWKDYFDATLFNSEGLPASSFSTVE